MIYELKYCITNKKYKWCINCFKSILPQKLVSNIVFLKNHHRLIDYKNPILLDEKLLVLKDGEYKDNNLVSLCADKYRVRDYIRNKGYDDILVKMLASYNSVDEIEWDKLPQRFVIKCNHGSGYNVIVTDKANANIDKIKNKLAVWMNQDFAVISSEHHYRAIERRIIVEEYIETENGVFPVDYKFFASRGQIICMLLISDRGVNKKRIYVDENFNSLQMINHNVIENFDMLKPKSFDKMLEIAKKLSEEFPFVRVDLYDKDGEVLFGELTFTPHGCAHNYLSLEAQKWMGSKIKL